MSQWKDRSPASRIQWKWFLTLIHQMIALKSNNQEKMLQHVGEPRETITVPPEFLGLQQLVQSSKPRAKTCFIQIKNT